jgi:acetylglutamate kinase
VALIHQLGVSLVIVIGSIKQIDEKMEKKGEKPNFSGEYRVTTENAMAAALVRRSALCILPRHLP